MRPNLTHTPNPTSSTFLLAKPLASDIPTTNYDIHKECFEQYYWKEWLKGRETTKNDSTHQREGLWNKRRNEQEKRIVNTEWKRMGHHSQQKLDQCRTIDDKRRSINKLFAGEFIWQNQLPFPCTSFFHVSTPPPSSCSHIPVSIRSIWSCYLQLFQRRCRVTVSKDGTMMKSGENWTRRSSGNLLSRIQDLHVRRHQPTEHDSETRWTLWGL